MEFINTAAAVRDGDRLHELLLKRRDLLLKVKEEIKAIDEESDKLKKRLAAMNDGQDFLFHSSDGYVKAVNLYSEEGKYDVDAMAALIVKLRRKVPRKEPEITIVVRHISEEEMWMVNRE